jgi:hypothetical protein
MATSPRSELRIVTVTEFTGDGAGAWQFATRSADGKEVMVGNAPSLADAVHVFFEAVGYDPMIVDTDDTKAHYSQLIPIEDAATGQVIEYHIREYAYGAPDPYIEGELP